jgi:hypothetical protein
MKPPVEYLRSRPIPVLALVEAMLVVLMRRASKTDKPKVAEPIQRRLELEKKHD